MTPATTPPAPDDLLGGAVPASGGIVFNVATEAQKAAQLWAEAQRVKRQPCTMKPWEENTYCLAPKYKKVDLINGVTTPLCGDDPQRILLVLSPQSFPGSNVFASTDPGLNSGVPVGWGFTNNGGPIIIMQSEHLIMASMAWYGLIIGANISISVIELALRDWPRR